MFILVFVLFIAPKYLMEKILVDGTSMECSLYNGEQVLIEKVSRNFNGPERFDIIIFEYPDDHSQYFIKRVIGLPGDTVRIAGGHVYINGSTEPLDESFIAEEQWPEPYDEELVYEVPEDSYFCLGDNRNHSSDSRDERLGCIDERLVLGKVLCVIFPFSNFGAVD